MSRSKRTDLEYLLPRISRWSGGLAVLVGSVVSCGWAFDVATLRSLLPGFPQMKLNAALAFVLAGSSVWLVNRSGAAYRTAARMCAAATVLIGLLTLSEYLFGRSLGIDQLFVHDHTAEGPNPGRIPLAGAVNFALLGTALLLLDLRGDNDLRLAQWLALVVALISFVVILGYAYEVTSLYRARASSPVALHGVILFVLLSIGVLFARPTRWPMTRAIAHEPDGVLIRRLLPAAILVPPTVGWIRLQGEQAGLYGTDLGLALYATANVIIFSMLIWSTARAVRGADEQRHVAERKLRVQVARLDLLNHITRAIGERQDLRSIFQVVVRSVEEQLPTDFAAVGLYDPAVQVLTIESVGVRSASLPTALAMPERARIAVDGSDLRSCLQGTLVYEPDISQVRFPLSQRLASAGLHALVIAPLRAESSVFGVLIAARREAESFSSPDCEFLRQLGEHVALATRQAQLYSTLQRAYDDLRQSRQTVVQQERLRALGQMASGIAHDVNNALSPMMLYTESLLEHEPHLSAHGRERLNIIQRGIDDVTQTVSRLSEFYRPRDALKQLTPVDLNRLVPQVVDLTRARWRDLPQGRGIVIELRPELAPALPKIMGSEGEIRDALTNLIFNAVDAMPIGGVLTLRTRVVRRSEPKNGAELPTHVCIETVDTGVGMDEETQQRCREPFFTTKGERGSGLGLAMVYGMAERHDAEFEIDSAVGTGTTIRLIFPVAGTGTASEAYATHSPGPLQLLRILVVDDDSLLARSLRDALQADGHLVTIADSGQLGIDTFLAAEARREPFGVVITDLGMPYVDGRKVAAAVRSASPTVPIVLLTGWGERLIDEQDIPSGVDRVLAKPPKLRELRAALGELTTGAMADTGANSPK